MNTQLDTKESHDTVKLRWIEMSSELTMKSLLLSCETLREAKEKALNNLNILILPEEKPLDAWCRSMAQENFLPVEKPVCRELLGAIQFNPSVMRFVFFLA